LTRIFKLAPGMNLMVGNPTAKVKLIKDLREKR